MDRRESEFLDETNEVRNIVFYGTVEEVSLALVGLCVASAIGYCSVTVRKGVNLRIPSTKVRGYSVNEHEWLTRPIFHVE
jgi:hypothetical protein